jgi:hypothetical protein
MTTLNHCRLCGSAAIEQTRGQMGQDDYRGASHHMRDEHGGMVHDPDYHKKVDLEAEHAHDMRVACTKCHNATGWDRRDVEEFKNHGPGDTRRVTVARDGRLDIIRQRWNDANPAPAAAA